MLERVLLSQGGSCNAKERKLVFEVDIRTQPLHRLLQGPVLFTGVHNPPLGPSPRIRR